MSNQLVLNLKLRAGSAFGNFIPGRNAQALERVSAAVGALPANWAAMNHPPGLTSIFLWGEPGCGKTHLLEAACRAAHDAGGSPAYVSFQDAHQFPVALLEGLEQAGLVALDDLQCMAGQSAWELAIFSLYEQLRARGGVLLTAARVNPATLGIGLPDLASRLGAGLVYQLHLPTDTDKLLALRQRSTQRGMDMPENVARYILAHSPRDMHALFELLDRIDQASLAAQRRLTIPFVRSLIGGA